MHFDVTNWSKRSTHSFRTIEKAREMLPEILDDGDEYTIWGCSVEHGTGTGHDLESGKYTAAGKTVPAQ